MSHSINGLLRTSWLMAGLAIVFGLALTFDARAIDGAPAWLKPAKFAVSLSIYGFTLAWMLRQFSGWPKVVCWGAWATTAAALVEMGLIAMQAGRGVASHFNTRTPFDLTVVIGTGVSYGTLFALLLAQALAGQPVSAPSGGFLPALVCWAAATAGLVAFAWHASRHMAEPNPHPSKETA